MIWHSRPIQVLLLMILLIFSTIPIVSSWNVTSMWVDSLPIHVSKSSNDMPAPRFFSPFAYDSESDRIVMYGGLNHESDDIDDHHNDTWVLNANSYEWQKMAPAIFPPRRGAHSLAYNNDTDRVILFGGIKTGSMSTTVQWNDTWEYNFNNDEWTNLMPDVSPPGRALAAMVYDSESEVMVLFGGGMDGFIFTDETWAYDYNENNWTQMNPASSPSVRVTQMVYDAKSDKVILFGGAGREGDTGPMNKYTDTWIYDYNIDKWTRRSPAQHPNSIGVLAYDAESDRVIMFGGSKTWYAPETDIVTETWSYHYDTNIWEKMEPIHEPHGRFASAMAYDSEWDRTVLYSGGWYEPGASFNSTEDCWAYDLDSNEWLPLSITIDNHPDGDGEWWRNLILLALGGFALVILMAVIVRRFTD